MNIPLRDIEPAEDAEASRWDVLALKDAMRRLSGGVVVITAGVGVEKTGLTATSAVSLSIDPPTMLDCISRSSSTWPVVLKRRHFCVNVVHASQADVAGRFSGFGGVKGAARYEGARWRSLGSGAAGLVGALAVIDCRVEEIIERHSHCIVLGAVLDVHGELGDGAALVYGHGRFGSLNLLPPSS